MLSRILQIFRSAAVPLCAETIAQILDKEPVVVDAMLQELTVMGRIRPAHVESACETCGKLSSCGLSTSSIAAYILTTKADKTIVDPDIHDVIIQEIDRRR